MRRRSNHVIDSLRPTVQSLILSASLILLPFLAQAQNTALSYDGNGGGTAYGSETCAPDEVLIGFDTKFSELLQKVVAAYPICRAVNGQGQWAGADTGVPTISFLFDGPTTQRKFKCGQNKAVDLLLVQSINEVLSFVIYCRPLNANGTIGGAREEAGRVPAMFYPGLHVTPPELLARNFSAIKRTDLECPSSLPARGIHGNKGLLVDRIGLRCRAPIVPSTITFTKTTVRSGEGNLGIVTLNRSNPNPLPMMIQLSSDVASVSVPASVALMPGGNTVVFPIGVPALTSNTVVKITAKVPNGKGPGASAGFVIQP